MKPSRLSRAELIGIASGAVLAVSIFLPWFSPSKENPNSNINGVRDPVSAWEALQILRWPLLLACIAPLILAYIVMRQHEVGWNRGEVTAVVGIVAFIIILCRGVIFGRPGSVEIGLSYGYGLALLAALGISFAGLLRQSESVEKKPPGV